MAPQRVTEDMDADEVAAILKGMDTFKALQRLRRLEADRGLEVLEALDRDDAARMLQHGRPAGVLAFLNEMDTTSVVEILTCMSKERVTQLVGAMDFERMTELFEDMDDHLAVHLFETLDVKRIAKLIEENTDESRMAELLQEMDTSVAMKIVQHVQLTSLSTVLNEWSIPDTFISKVLTVLPLSQASALLSELDADRAAEALDKLCGSNEAFALQIMKSMKDLSCMVDILDESAIQQDFLANVMQALPLSQAAHLMSQLDSDRSAEALEKLCAVNEGLAVTILGNMSDMKQVASLFNEASSSRDAIVKVMRVVPPAKAMELLSELDSDRSAEALEKLCAVNEGLAITILGNMSDIRAVASLFDEASSSGDFIVKVMKVVPPAKATQLLSLLDSGQSDEVQKILDGADHDILAGVANKATTTVGKSGEEIGTETSEPAAKRFCVR